MKKKESLKKTVLLFIFIMVITACQADFSSSENVQLQNQEELNFQKFDYVFRVVDVSDLTDSRSVNQFFDYTTELKALAAIFSDIKPSNGSRSAENKLILNELAQTAVIAYTNPDVLVLVDNLASNGLYVQFAYKEFLIDQCIIPDNSRSIGQKLNITTKKALVFNGNSPDPLKWNSEYIDLKSISVQSNTRSITSSSENEISLSIAKDRMHIIDEYTQIYADILYSSPESIVTELADNTFLIENGNTITTIKIEDMISADNSRGIFDDFKNFVTSKVDSIATAFKTSPIFTTIAITFTAGCTLVYICSGLGIITLPAWLAVTTNTITFFL